MIFKNATVITMDPRRRIILNGAVAVRGSRIESVVKSKELSRKFSAEICILEMLKSGTTTFMETFLAARYGLDGIMEVHPRFRHPCVRGQADHG